MKTLHVVHVIRNRINYFTACKVLLYSAGVTSDITRDTPHSLHFVAPELLCKEMKSEHSCLSGL